MNTKIYCSHCNSAQPLEIEEMVEYGPGNGIWGDLLCATCGVIIATLTVGGGGSVGV